MKLKKTNIVLSAGCLAIFFTSAGCAAEPELWTLKSYWHDGRVDYFGTATSAGQNAAINAFGYGFSRDEGQVYAAEQPGTVALELYWSEEFQDNATIASEDSKKEVIAKGYENKATEGYIYSSEQPGSIPLKLYFKPEINEYYSTTSETGEKAALEQGFQFVRIEGYLPGQ